MEHIGSTLEGAHGPHGSALHRASPRPHTWSMRRPRGSSPVGWLAPRHRAVHRPPLPQQAVCPLLRRPTDDSARADRGTTTPARRARRGGRRAGRPSPSDGAVGRRGPAASAHPRHRCLHVSDSPDRQPACLQAALRELGNNFDVAAASVSSPRPGGYVHFFSEDAAFYDALTVEILEIGWGRHRTTRFLHARWDATRNRT